MRCSPSPLGKPYRLLFVNPSSLRLVSSRDAVEWVVSERLVLICSRTAGHSSGPGLSPKRSHATNVSQALMRFASSPWRMPGVEESTSYGATSLKLRGKLIACQAINKSAEPNCSGREDPLRNTRRADRGAARRVLRDRSLRELPVRRGAAVSRPSRLTARSPRPWQSRFVGETTKKPRPRKQAPFAKARR